MIRRRDLFGMASGAALYLGCGGRELGAGDDRCEPTPADGEGPFYRAGAPLGDGSLADGVEGERVQLSGQLLVAASCAPLAGAELDLWQADADGAYDLDGYRLRGKLLTDAEGRYRIETIKPGNYLDRGAYRPAHIHVIVRAASGAELTTQIYFAGDPYLETEPQPDAQIASFSPSGGLLLGEHDIII